MKSEFINRDKYFYFGTAETYFKINCGFTGARVYLQIIGKAWKELLSFFLKYMYECIFA